MNEQIKANAGERWARRHANGYMAVVNVGSDALYTANALDVGDTKPEWAKQHIPDLLMAQETADAKVPPHDCQCAGWHRYEGSGVQPR